MPVSRNVLQSIPSGMYFINSPATMMAGELNHTLGGSFYTDIVIGKVGNFDNPIKVAEETMATLPHKRVAFICLHTYAGVRIVRGLIYEGHDHGFFYIEEWNGNHCVVVLDKGEFKRKE